MILANLASLLPTAISALERSISALESSISALDNAIPALESSVKSWEYVGFAGAFVVVLGVLLELHDIWHRYDDDMTTWALSYFSVSRPLERPRFFKKFGIEVASVILVAGGVACELGAGFMIESKNIALRAIDIQLRSKNSELRDKSNQLVLVVTQEAEVEKRKRLQLAASLLDRYFRNQSGAIEELSRLGSVSVIFRFPQEREIRKTAEQINFVVGQLHWKSSLQPAGWYVNPGVTVTPGRPQFSGTGSNLTRVNEWQKTQAICEAVAKALSGSGLDATAPGPIQEDLPLDTIVITVGEKPNHVLEDAIKELGEPPQPTPTGRFHAKYSGVRVEFPDSHVTPCATPCKAP